MARPCFQIISIEALSLGTPIVTADSLGGGMGLTAGMYRRMQMEDLIAKTEQEYCKLAIMLGRARQKTALYRQKIRSASRLLYNDEKVVIEWETFLRYAHAHAV